MACWSTFVCGAIHQPTVHDSLRLFLCWTAAHATQEKSDVEAARTGAAKQWGTPTWPPLTPPPMFNPSAAQDKSDVVAASAGASDLVAVSHSSGVMFDFSLTGEQFLVCFFLSLTGDGVVFPLFSG